MVPDRIEREVTIDAPREVVWEVVTRPEHVARWFSDAAEIDLRPGGAALLTWHEHGAARARVERVEPPRRFAFRWMRGAESLEEGLSTLVEFELTARDDGTLLRVVESGFRELDLPEDERARYAGENTEGWRQELDELREYAAGVARAAGRP